MTIILVLGLFAGLYMIRLLFSLASLALPVGATILTAFWLRNHGHGILAAIIVGFLIGIVIHVVGQFLFQNSRSPLLRTLVALAFVVPAAIVGFYAVDGVARLAIGAGVVRTLIGSLGSISIGYAAWSGLSKPTGGAVRTESPREYPARI